MTLPPHLKKIIHFVWVGLALVLILQISGSLEGRDFISDREISAGPDKIKGIHYFGRRGNSLEGLVALRGSNIKEVVLVPYAYQERHDDPLLHTSGRRRNNRSSRDSSYLAFAEEARALNLTCIVKPHIWMKTDQGTWRSDIHFSNQADWTVWSEAYTTYILHYAELSERMGADAFCIGTELSKLTLHHPEYWSKLIREVRAIYRGQVFYAANWFEEFEHITFWGELDFIGIQAYFPLSKQEEPSISDLCKAWKPLAQRLGKFSRTHGKPILFTELGYKSTGDAAIEPWRWLSKEDEAVASSPQTQANCYEAFFRSVWDEPWFAGVMLWQWQGTHRAVNRMERDFTPQSKPAEQIMSNWFAK